MVLCYDTGRVASCLQIVKLFLFIIFPWIHHTIKHRSGPHAMIITTKYDVGSFLCSLIYPVLSSSFYKFLFHPFEHLCLYLVSQFGLGVSMPASRSAGLGSNPARDEPQKLRLTTGSLRIKTKNNGGLPLRRTITVYEAGYK